VITTQIDTSVLIAKSQLIVLIVSAVIYEALNQNKKVMVYKKINYERQLILARFPNVYFFDSAFEVFEVLVKENAFGCVNFYKKTDYSMIKTLLVD